MRSGSRYILLILLVLVTSCSEYEKLLKSSDYDLKKVKAREYYDAGKYAKATELLAQLLPRYRATEEAEDLNWINAQSFYKMKDYFSAGTYFKSYIDQYPFGKYTEEATFMGALCDYNISPRAELDQENTKNAIEGFNIFITKYPYSPRVEECTKYIKELEERLVEKSYLSAKLYYDMKQYKAAITALTNSLKEFSETKYREEMMFLKLNSLFLYAENSLAGRQKERYQATLDDYYSFMEEFPESKYSKDVKKIFQKTSDYLKIGNSEPVANNQ
jgi:outer membrane protein assembly factor BamD